MRTLIITLTALFCFGHSKGQINCLYNPSFEQYWRCPNNYDEIKFANFWSPISDTFSSFADTVGNPNCSPEFCHTCAINNNVAIPNNARFNNFPRTGNGMSQVYMYYREDFDSTEIYRRDYLQGRLKRNLIAGQSYCITFYVALEQMSGYFINHIGAYFDDGTIDTATLCGLPQTTHIPQVYESSIISTTQWTKIQGTFTAAGNEKFMTIGNFVDGAHTDTIPNPTAWILGGYASWYLVDDISVIKIGTVANAGNDTTIYAGDTAWVGNHDDYLPCKWYTVTGALIDSNHAGFAVHPTTTTRYVMELDVCGTLSYDTITVSVIPVGINGITMLGNIKIYPNPAKNDITITGIEAPTNYQILNVVGTTLTIGTLSKGSNTLPLGGLTPGVYLLELLDNNGGRYVQRIVKE